MKVTTVRFGTDLWKMLEREAAQDGVSVSQYIREAALARATMAAMARGEDALAVLAGAPPRSTTETARPEMSAPHRGETARGIAAGALVGAAGNRAAETRIAAEAARRRARDTREEAHATAAEAEQAIRRAHRRAASGDRPRAAPGDWPRDDAARRPPG